MLSTRQKINVHFGCHHRRAAVLAAACSARTAAQRPPCIASGYVCQNLTFISRRVLSAACQWGRTAAQTSSIVPGADSGGLCSLAWMQGAPNALMANAGVAADRRCPARSGPAPQRAKVAPRKLIGGGQRQRNSLDAHQFAVDYLDQGARRPDRVLFHLGAACVAHMKKQRGDGGHGRQPAGQDQPQRQRAGRPRVNRPGKPGPACCANG